MAEVYYTNDTKDGTQWSGATNETPEQDTTTNEDGSTQTQDNVEPDEVIEEQKISWYSNGTSSGKISMEELDEKLYDIAKSNSAYSIDGIGLTLDDSRAAQAITKQITGIFGIPYQFSDIVDPVMYSTADSEKSSSKSDSSDPKVGRSYTEKILSVMPVLFLTPGEPVFMPDSGSGAKEYIAQKILSASSALDGDGDSPDLGDGRYYSFNSNFEEYRYYVNTSLRVLAYYMGIKDVEVPIPGKNETVKLGDIDIEDFLNNDFSKIFGTQIAIPFYLDAENSISESFSNDSTESQFAQTANSLSSTVNEVRFLLGSGDSSGGLTRSITSALQTAGENLLDSAAGAVEGLSEAFIGKTMLSKISNQLTTVVSGGKLVFPKIWGGSDYSKQYNIRLKLRSPDPDPVSIFLNIYMPIVLLINMAAPKQLGNSDNSYESPFLVRATYRSIFNCDLGMISQLTITKGDKNRWNVMGMPMTADIDITIEDLYHNMMVSKRMGIMNNTAELDYLATLAGIELQDMDVLRNIKLGLMLLGDTPKDITSGTWGKIKRAAGKFVLNRISALGDIRYQ